MTTIKELYEWAIENGVENIGIGIQWADDGGNYSGNSYDDFGSDISVRIETAKNGEKFILLEA